VLNARGIVLRFAQAEAWIWCCVVSLRGLPSPSTSNSAGSTRTQPQRPCIERRVSETLFYYSLTMVARSQTSAAGVLALLSEPEPVFKQHALKALNPLVPQFWAEISEHIALMFVQVHLVAFQPVSDRFFNSEKLCTRVMTFLRMLETRLPFWQARSTTFWESTTKHSLSLSGRETRLKPKVALMGQRNMSRLSFVSGT
jgi:hypothetical protein